MRRPNLRRADGDRGAVLVVFALLMVALVLVVAIVIDLGTTRSDRRGGQLAADNAAAAAGRSLADPATDPAAACNEALQFLAVSLQTPAFTVTSPTTCATLSARCSADRKTALVALPAAPVVATSGSGRYTATIEYPVADGSALLAKTSTIGASTTTSTIPATYGNPCQRIGVQVATTGPPFFGGIASSANRTSTVWSVAVGIPGSTGKGIPAFLMLERVDCGALVENNASGIYVRESVLGTTPGTIHLDSLAVGDCGGSTKGYAVYGSPQSDGTTSIRVYPSTVAVPPDTIQDGAIFVAATNSKAGAQYPTGINAAPTTGATIASRAPVDKKYNGTGSTAITDLHAAAYGALTEPTSNYSTANGWATVDCNGVPPVGAMKVFVDCSSFNRSATYDFSVSPGSQLVFGGEIDLKGNGKSIASNASTVTVRGKMSLGSNSASFPSVTNMYVADGVSVGTGTLAVNSTLPTACSGGTSAATRLAIFGGSPAALALSGTTSLCSTAVYLAGPLTAANAIYTPQQLDLQTPDPSCTPEKPCPKKNGDGNTATGAHYTIGGGVTVTWTAPNAHPGIFSGPQGVEDLALWMEGGTDVDIGNGSNLVVSGVMFAPNARFNVRSPATALPLDAQFIARSLWLYQGNLTMRPTEGNVVEVPSLGKSSLIR